MYVTHIYPELTHDQAWHQGWRRSQELTQHDPDEFWLASIATCYTAGRDLQNQQLDEDIDGISVHRTPRAGGMTYYGPGQLHVCTVFNVERNPQPNFSVRVLTALTRNLNQNFGLGQRQPPRFEYSQTDPGIYEISTGNKIASLGFYQNRGWLLGGAVINFCVDLAPYNNIAPCGVDQRAMGNILSYEANWDRLVSFGDSMILHLTQELYHDQQNGISTQGKGK